MDTERRRLTRPGGRVIEFLAAGPADGLPLVLHEGTPVGLVSAGNARRLANLRARPRASVVARVGWQWAAAEGPVELAGPDDPMPGVDAERLRLLLREIFTAAGGTHDDFDAYDRAMADERRVAVLVTPARISPAGPG